MYSEYTAFPNKKPKKSWANESGDKKEIDIKKIAKHKFWGVNLASVRCAIVSQCKQF